MEKVREFQKNIYFCFIAYTKAFDCVDPNKLWEILKEMRVPGHLTCLLRNLYVGQETTVRTKHETTDCQNWERSTSRLYIVTLLIYLLHQVHHAKCWVDESQAGIKIAGRNINNLRYADDTVLMAESEEELKSLLMRVKEENGKTSLKLNMKITKVMASGPITSWQIEGEKAEGMTDFLFLGSKIAANSYYCSYEIKSC